MTGSPYNRFVAPLLAAGCIVAARQTAAAQLRKVISLSSASAERDRFQGGFRTFSRDSAAMAGSVPRADRLGVT